jgi:hypothetical protein
MHLPAAKFTYSLSNRTDHVGVTTLKRLVQGHLHPKLKSQDRPRIEPGPLWWGRVRYFRKEPFEQLVDSYSEHLHMSARPVENASDKTIIVDLSAGLNVSSTLWSGSPQFSGVMSRKDQAPDPLKPKADSEPEIRC